jgi:hypothetical protein
MKTDPDKHEIIEDWSEVEAVIAAGKEREARQFDANLEEQLAPLRAQLEFEKSRGEAERIRAIADRRKMTGAAFLMAGAGIGLAAYGLSTILPPKIVHDTVVTEKVVTVDRPVVTEKVVKVPEVKFVDRPAPVAPAKLKVGDKTTEQDYKNSAAYQSTEIKGKIVSHVDGVIRFENGREFHDADARGNLISVTNKRHDGDVGMCAVTGKFPDGNTSFECTALHRGVVEKLSITGNQHETAHVRPQHPLPTAPRADRLEDSFN